MKIQVIIIAAVSFFLLFNRNPEIKPGHISLQGNQTSGSMLYTKYCMTCHQADGKGVRGMFPPLAGNAKITGPSSDLIKIVLFGLQGPITVNEREYNQPMPPQGYLNDTQIADILNYIRNSWDNKAQPVTPEDVGKIRKLGKPRKVN
jgi:mono/diheme cytochrome c family protein